MNMIAKFRPKVNGSEAVLGAMGVTRFSCRGNRSLAIFFGARQRIPLARGLLPCNERTRPTDLTLARFAAEAMP